MEQPSDAKRSRKLRPSPRWKGKASRKRKPNPKPSPNPNPNPRRQKQRSVKATRPQDHSTYNPPRLHDLQFQNRLKAFRHFPERCDALSMAAYTHMYDGSATSASGFRVPSFNTLGGFLADVRVGGVPQTGFDFPARVCAYNGSLVYPGKGPSFPVPNPRLINSQVEGSLLPGTLLYAGTHDAGLVPMVANPAGAFAIGSNDSGAASTSAAFPRSSSKGNRRFKAFRRSQRAITGVNMPLGAPAAPTSFLKRAKQYGGITGGNKQLGAPAAPRNTTSFLMRAKKSGGIASFVSPSPVTPAVIPTPVVSPFVPFTGLAGEANNEWGVNDYGSMSGLIRLRSLDYGSLDYGGNNDSESEVEQGAQSVQQLEQRFDHDVGRFVMTYPRRREEMGNGNPDNLDFQRVGDQDSHIAHLEEENMDLKERLFSVQQEVEFLRRRLRVLGGVSSSDDDAEVEASPERSDTNMSCL